MNMAIDIGLTKDQRSEMAEGLSRLLADTYTLYLKTHNYHWNVTGPWFSSLHDLFEQHYTEMAQAVDEIAERIRALGEPAPGSYAAFGRRTAIVEDAEDAVPGAEQMIANLVKDHETVIRTARELVPMAESANDETTADLLAGRLKVHEETAWMLRSHLA